MKEFYQFCSMAFVCLALSILNPHRVLSQVQTARNITINANSNGFYEYLPAGYGSGGQTYPLMVFIHGIGELGNGTSDLPNVLHNGPPKLISQGNFPSSFSVNGKTFSFIVISPQFVAWPTAGDVKAYIDYAIKNYRVDINRIYLTGLSMGGGVVWDYASQAAYVNQLAAILPISGGNLWGGTPAAKVMAAANLPILAASNLNDPTVPSHYTWENINLINSIVPAIRPAAQDTIFPASGHDAWSATYDPSFKKNGLNVYQWMLQYSTNDVVLPIELTDFTATLSANNQQVAIHWATSQEVNNKYFILQRSADGQKYTDQDTVPASLTSGPNQYNYIDYAPLGGDNFYRLMQVDLDGKTTISGVRKVTIALVDGTAFRLGPNPTRNILTLNLTGGETGNLEISLTDLQGRVLKNWKSTKQGYGWEQVVDVSFLARGNYFIRVQGTTTRIVKQFVKE
ncbi:T9SS type A sorting domain-containing protein [Flavitalea flava]